MTQELVRVIFEKLAQVSRNDGAGINHGIAHRLRLFPLSGLDPNGI